jgi:hypothetical protein
MGQLGQMILQPLAKHAFDRPPGKFVQYLAALCQ